MWTLKPILLLFLIFFSVEALPVLEERGTVGHIVDIVGNFFRGTGTFFHPKTEGGAIGSCGPIASDHSRICAMVCLSFSFNLFPLTTITHTTLHNNRTLNNMEKRVKRVHGAFYNYV
jgi:hypothetical protein